jgi:hypothetical protein
MSNKEIMTWMKPNRGMKMMMNNWRIIKMMMPNRASRK